MIVIAILAIIAYNDDIVNFITESGIPLAVDPEILTIIGILLIVDSIFQKLSHGHIVERVL